MHKLKKQHVGSCHFAADYCLCPCLGVSWLGPMKETHHCCQGVYLYSLNPLVAQEEVTASQCISAD